MGHGLCLVLLPFQRCLKTCLLNEGKCTSHGGIVQTNTVYTSAKNETATNILINKDEHITYIITICHIVLPLPFIFLFS